MRFDFNEANILKQNLFSSQDDKVTLLRRLEGLCLHTEDSILKKSLRSLIRKVEELNDEEVKRILYDILQKKFVVTSNYKAIHSK